MDETVKLHLDAIADHLKGTKHAFLFLMNNEETTAVCKNCSESDTAALMLNYIEGTPTVYQAFTNHVIALQETEEQNNKEK